MRKQEFSINSVFNVKFFPPETNQADHFQKDKDIKHEPNKVQKIPLLLIFVVHGIFVFMDIDKLNLIILD
jgi:hypothetical protein